MKLVLYHIAGWSDDFENNRTRELKHMDWVRMPNQMDGDGYTELVEVGAGEADIAGALRFAAWCAIVEIASRCHPRGTLVRDGARPHDSASLARMSRLPQSIFDFAIPFLKRIGWLESQMVDFTTDTIIPQEGAGLPQEGAAPSRAQARNGTERNGTERNGTEENPLTPKGGTLPAEMRDAPQEANGELPPDKATADGPETDCAANAGGAERRRKSAPEEAPPGFQRFWKEYPSGPRKVDKSGCLRLWLRKKLEPLVDSVVSALARSKSSRYWTKNSGEFIPMPMSWLNKTPWETEPAEMAESSLESDDNGFQRAPVTDEILRIAFGDEEAPG